MADSNELIYKNSNKYRLHADNLRWSLLGGYIAFAAAVFSFSKNNNTDSVFLTTLACFVSFAYLWVLAVQNWFYNLFARLVDGRTLQSLQSFAQQKGKEISPYHPAFFFAELIVGSITYYFLCLTTDKIYIPWITDLIYKIHPTMPLVLKGIGFVFFFLSLHMVFRKWNSLVYEPIIKKLSNLYKPVDR